MAICVIKLIVRTSLMPFLTMGEGSKEPSQYTESPNLRALKDIIFILININIKVLIAIAEICAILIPLF